MPKLSSYATVNKPKRLRRRKKRIPRKPPIELTLEEKTAELYDQLIAASPRIPLPEKLKDKKYYELLKRVGRGRVSKEALQSIIDASEEHLLVGPIGRELDVDSKVRTIFKLGGTSMSDCYQESFTFIAMRLPSGKIGLTNRDGDIYEYGANTMIYAEKLGTIKLPMDLREWSSRWMAAFFRLRLRHAETHGSCNGGRIGYKVATLHNIRRINSSPSKKQRREISKNISKPVFDADEVGLDVEYDENFE